MIFLKSLKGKKNNIVIWYSICHQYYKNIKLELVGLFELGWSSTQIELS